MIVFSAHSLPISTVNRGDSYVPEVHKTVSKVMNQLRMQKVLNRHVISWQSKVGANTWQGPQTDQMLKSLAQQNIIRVMLVPVAFTTDHIETLFEIDKEYKDLAKKAGIVEFRRTCSMNGYSEFSHALKNIVHKHLEKGENFSGQYNIKCANCWQPEVCRKIINPKF